MTTPVTESPAPLEPGMRCDRCGAEAYVRASKNGMSLHFCGHHGGKNTDALILTGFTVDDFRKSLTEKPSLSAV